MSPGVFKKLVYPSVKEIIEGGWEQATPETLLIALALQRLWGVCMHEILFLHCSSLPIDALGNCCFKSRVCLNLRESESETQLHFNGRIVLTSSTKRPKHKIINKEPFPSFL